MLHHPISRGRRATAWAAILCCVLLSQACTQWTEEQRKRQSLPDFQFENLQGGSLQRSDLPANQAATIFYFDPDCSHCKITLDNLQKKIDAFAQNTLVMVSPADRSQLIPALSQRGFLERKGILIGLCTPQQFLDTFGTTQTPTMLFYAADFDLKMAYKGAVDIPGLERGLAASVGQ